MANVFVTVLSVFVFSNLLLSQNLHARTYPTNNFLNDKGSDSAHVFGNYEFSTVYTEADFNEALLNTSPLHDPKFESYDVVVITTINTTRDPLNDSEIRGQTIRVYVRKEALARVGSSRFDLTQYDEATGLLFYWKVSTARQGKSTPRGYYRPESFSSDHKSSLYNNAPMPWTVFFIGNIGTHGVLGKAISQLGTAASAGCIRLEPQRGKDLFHLIGFVGKGWVDKIDRAGNLSYTQNGEIIQENNWKTLIIVQ